MTAVARRGQKTGEEIRGAALELFSKRGFQATTLREVAAKVGIQVGSLYNHIASKGELLFEIMESVMLDLLEDQREAAKAPDVVDRMRLLVDHHVKFHGRRAREVFVGNSELRSLRPAQRARIIALRDQYEQVFRNELEDGIRQGKFLPVDVRVTTYGILAMTTSVSTFYSPRGRLSLEEIAEIFADMVLQGLWNPTAGQLETHLEQARIAGQLERHL
jgi:AcrR family transcriptional regulator